MNSRPTNLKTEQFDMDSLVDFNNCSTQPSPATASSSKNTSRDFNVFSPFDQQEERQQFSGPSHDYTQYKQQVGLPVGSINMPQQSMFDDYSSGIGDMAFDGFHGFNSGIDIDADVNMDFNNPQSAMPAMFFPPPVNDSQSDNFINPTTLGAQEEPTTQTGRLWPGIHTQQAQEAAMQKARHAQAMQQRQAKMQAQHAQYRQTASGSQSSQASTQQGHGHSKRPSTVTESHVDESISRLLNQMRNNSAASADDDDDSQAMLPHIARMKKDEEEMDEDERLLASEEGKKLSSKERRQLRNKVSARAFRSRRKEYIGQLEGEVAMKAQESQDLRTENQALMQENERYRGLIETLLRHPSFRPFIEDISQDPSVFGVPQKQAPHPQPQQPLVAPQQQPPQPQQQPQQAPQQDSKAEYLNFDASQLQIPSQQPQQREQVGLAMIPEHDFRKLNINGFQSMNFNNYRAAAYAVTDVPKGPDPVDLLIETPARLPLSCSASTCSTNATATSDSGLTVLLAKLDRTAARITSSTGSCV